VTLETHAAAGPKEAGDWKKKKRKDPSSVPDRLVVEIVA